MWNSEASFQVVNDALGDGFTELLPPMAWPYENAEFLLWAIERLAECRGCRNRVEIEGLTDAGRLDEFVNEITARRGSLDLQTEQDDVLREREAFRE